MGSLCSSCEQNLCGRVRISIQSFLFQTMHCLEPIMAVADILLLCCLSDGPFARWRHFTTTTITAIILQGIVFLCDENWDDQFEYERKTK